MLVVRFNTENIKILLSMKSIMTSIGMHNLQLYENSLHTLYDFVIKQILRKATDETTLEATSLLLSRFLQFQLTAHFEANSLTNFIELTKNCPNIHHSLYLLCN